MIFAGIKKAVGIGLVGLMLLTMRCGSLTNEDPAVATGGSGAGNPSGIVKVSMGVSSTSSSAKMTAVAALADDPDGFTGPVTVTTTDEGGTSISLTTIELSGVIIHFLVDSSENPASLLAAMHSRPAYLSSDSNSIIYTRQASFNVLCDSADSLPSTLSLPIAKYIGVKITLPQVASAGGAGTTGNNQIVLNGTFAYFGVSHSLNVGIAYSQGSCNQNYSFAGGIFTLSASDTTHLQLQFKPSRWFSSINVATGLENGDYSFDGGGTLNLSNYSTLPSVEWAGETVASDFLASGKLTVY